MKTLAFPTRLLLALFAALTLNDRGIFTAADESHAASYPASGLHASGFQLHGYPATGSPAPRSTSSGLHAPGYPASAFHGPTYPALTYPFTLIPAPGSPSAGMHAPGYPTSVMHAPTYPAAAFPGPGFPAPGSLLTNPALYNQQQASRPGPRGNSYLSSSSKPALERKGFRVEPYGAFWANMTYATQRTSPGAFTLFVFSEEDQGEDAFETDVRRTQVGLNISGPRLGSAETGGKVEIDFLGQFVTENRANVRLRDVYWEAKNARTRILVGQTVDVVSPLSPSTLNFGGGFFAGNIGFRRAQFRAERYAKWSEHLRLTLQGSLNQDIVTDFASEPGVLREASDWPVAEARAAIAIGADAADARSVTLGISGHIGETGFDFITAGPPPLNLPAEDDARFKTWSFNVDLKAPITQDFGFQGEFFTGANLSNLLGGIGQGVCPCLRVPIRSIGGWGEVWYDWAPFHFHTGYGLDDPNDKDILVGRSSNQFIFSNFVYDITDQFITGLEVTYWKTLYQETRAGQIPADQLGPTKPGEAVTIDWMIKYEF